MKRHVTADIDPEALFDLHLPPDWRPVTVPVGRSFALSGDIERYGDDSCSVPVSVDMWVVAAETESDADAAERLMARRVRQGHPDRFVGSIAGMVARGFEWTDGVRSIVSYFVNHPTGALVEISVATLFYPDEPLPPRPLRKFADELFACTVAVLPPTHAESLARED